MSASASSHPSGREIRRIALPPETTTIGVVSDTHLPHFGRALPGPLLAGLRAAHPGAIIHCGDFTELADVVPELERIAPVIGVAGNNDGPAIIERYGRRALILVGRVRIGVVHGDGGRGTTHDRAARAFLPERLDAICFGHSHVPLLEAPPGGTLLLNPGSPTDKRRMPTYTYAVLRIREGGTIAAEIVAYSRR